MDFPLYIKFQGSLLISRDHDNRTPLDLSRIHNNWPAYLILRLNENHAFNDELKSIVTYFLDVFEKMKVTDLNSIKLHMIHFSATNNIEGMVNLLDMFDDTEETWFPVSCAERCTLMYLIFLIVFFSSTTYRDKTLCGQTFISKFIPCLGCPQFDIGCPV